MRNTLAVATRYEVLKGLYEGGHLVSKDDFIEAQGEYIEALKEDIAYQKELIEEYRYDD
ncbi:hypothetical protein LCFBJUUZ_CDS0162 [Staphylococcus phage PG-2021_76]